MKTFKSGSLRPVDLAREVGLSAQAVRNYEDDRILPPAIRGPNGYRIYTPLHLAALKAFAALAAAMPHSSARGVMRAINSGQLDEALEIIDTEHGQLLKDRQTVRTIQSAFTGVETDPVVQQSSTSSFSIGELARRIGVTSTTIRGWEQVGILAPERQAETGHRQYTNEDVRDAELAYLLRRGRQRLSDIALIIREVRTAGSTEALREAANQWHTRLTDRGRALLSASAELHHYLDARIEIGHETTPAGQ